jgi:hypothetical protein
MTGSEGPPVALSSSLLGYEAVTGSLDIFGFEDIKSILIVRYSVIYFQKVISLLYHMYKQFCNSLFIYSVVTVSLQQLLPRILCAAFSS